MSKQAAVIHSQSLGLANTQAVMLCTGSSIRPQNLVAARTASEHHRRRALAQSEVGKQRVEDRSIPRCSIDAVNRVREHLVGSLTGGHQTHVDHACLDLGGNQFDAGEEADAGVTHID